MSSLFYDFISLRCVLAASSPVLASLLSSTGVLVELQAPCLNGSVLPLILDYIYTGTLPNTCTQQQYCKLLTAACYLQMDKLQEALRAWKQTEMDEDPNAKELEKWTRREELMRTVEDRRTSSHYTPAVHGMQRNTKEDVQQPSLHPLSTPFLPLCQSHHLKDGGSPSQCSSSLSSSSPPPCCWAVPVICHSSKANMLQLADGVSTLDPLCPLSQASASSRTSLSQTACERVYTARERTHTGSNDNVTTAICSTSEDRSLGKEQDYRYREDHFGMHSLDSYHGRIQGLFYNCNTDQSKVQDYRNTCHFVLQNDKHCMGNVLPHMTHHIAVHGSLQSETNEKHFGDNSVSQNKDRTNFSNSKDNIGLKDERDLSFDAFPHKQWMENSDCHDDSMAINESFHSQDQDLGRIVASTPVQDTDTGSESHYADLYPRGKEEEEHSCSSRFRVEIDRSDSHSNCYELTTDWNDNDSDLKQGEKGTTDPTSSLHKSDRDNRDTIMTDHKHNADSRQPPSIAPESTLHDGSDDLSASEPHASLEQENISDTYITDAHSTFTMPVDSNVNDPLEPTYNVAGQSYRGHLYCHRLCQEDIHSTHNDSESVNAVHFYANHANKSTDEEEVGSYAGSHSQLSQHFARGTEDKVLLLDISAKPAELLVSYRRRSWEREKEVAFGRMEEKDTVVARNDNREQWTEANFVAGTNKRENRARTKFGVENLDESETKTCVGERGLAAIGKDQSSGVECDTGARAKAIHKAGSRVREEVSSTEAEHRVKSVCQTSSLTVRIPPSVPSYVQASVSSSLSVCIPSPLSASMPTNISAHLPTAVHHPFHCSLCDRTFSQRGSLNRHMRSHLGVRPFPCPRCPMTFARQYRVTEHLRVHQRCALGNDFQKLPDTSV